MREPPTKRAGSGAGAVGAGEAREASLDFRHDGLVVDRACRRDHHLGSAIIAREIGGEPLRSNERTVAGVPRIERPIG